MKNIEYHENIAEVGENNSYNYMSRKDVKKEEIIVPIIKRVEKFASFVPHDILMPIEEWKYLMSYVRHQGAETSEVLVQCQTAEDLDNNSSLKIGLLCRISGFFRSRQNNVCKLRVIPIKSVKVLLIDQTQIQDCDHTQIQNLNAIGLTLGKVSDIKYQVSDFNRLLLLVEEVRNLMPRKILWDYPMVLTKELSYLM